MIRITSDPWHKLTIALGLMSVMPLAACSLAPSTPAGRLARTPTHAPLADRHPQALKVGEIAPAFSLEMAARMPHPGAGPFSMSSLSDGKHDNEFTNGTLFLAPDQLDRPAAIEIVNGDTAGAIAATKAVQAAIGGVNSHAAFADGLRIDAFADDVGDAATSAWFGMQNPIAIPAAIVTAAGAGDIWWGFESDADFSRLPHALRDVYAHGTYPTVVLVDKAMKVLFIARGRAAKDRQILTRAVTETIIAADKG